MRSLLVIAPFRFGDVVMAQSLFKVLKAQEPARVIDVLAPGWMRPLLERMPEVTHALDMQSGHDGLQLGMRRRLGVALRDRHYDQAIVLPDSLGSALIPYRAGIPLRSGYSGGLRHWFLNDCRRLDVQRLPGTVQRFVGLGLPDGATLSGPIPAPALVSDEVRQHATAKQLGVVNQFKPALALCPGSETWTAKQWPEEYYARVARHWLNQDWRVWLFGSGMDAPVCERINTLAGDGCHNLAGRTSPGEVIDLLAMAAFVVTNDSGLMHAAAALQRPMVAIFGSSDPASSPPLSETAKVEWLGLECSPCGKRECPLGHLKCLREISPERVILAMDEVMKR
jgi:lipopolysaccharide heptosyltransferase II